MEKPQTEFTPRQLKVIRLVVAERTDKEIGYSLDICRRTVRHHLTAIYAKLGWVDGIQSSGKRIRLVKYALRNRIAFL